MDAKIHASKSFFPFRYICDTEFFQGDSGGPLWVREKKKGVNLPVAYLVSKTRLRYHHPVTFINCFRWDLPVAGQGGAVLDLTDQVISNYSSSFKACKFVQFNLSS